MRACGDSRRDQPAPAPTNDATADPITVLKTEIVAAVERLESPSLLAALHVIIRRLVHAPGGGASPHDLRQYLVVGSAVFLF